MRGGIECACLVCHGPIRGNAKRVLCGMNCRSAWRFMLQGAALGRRYEDLRMVHAYRREKLSVLSWLAARVPGAALLLEVSA